MLRKHFRLLSPDTGGGNSTATDPQAGDGGNAPQPQAGTTTSTEPQAGESQSETFSLEEAKKLRSEAANLRKRLKAFEEAEQQAKDAQKTEQQRIQDELAELRSHLDNRAAELLEARVHAEIGKLASKFNFLLSPDLVAQLLNWSQIEVDEDTGKPTNVEKLLADLAKSAPDIVRKQAAPTSGGATNPPRSQTADSVEITQAYVNRLMSNKAEWDGLPQDQRTRVLNWLAKNPFRF